MTVPKNYSTLENHDGVGEGEGVRKETTQTLS